MMIQKIFSFDEYEGFVNELSKHPQYSDPHFTYDKNNLYCSLKSKDKHAYVVLENGITKGLFVFIVLPDDRYVEMLIGFSKEEEVLIEMLNIWKGIIVDTRWILCLIHKIWQFINH